MYMLLDNINQSYSQTIFLNLTINLLNKSNNLLKLFMLASSISDFELLSQIGRGTYAKVVLVRSRQDDKLYAIKILNKKHIIQRGQEVHIITEKKILAQISHPFLIKLHSAFQDHQNLYLVLQYCPGGQLFNLLLMKDCLTQDQAKFYAAQIILALEQLHAQNIIYRDLKPQNVIIDKKGYLKLTDFGLSKILESQDTKTMSICGTPQYLAPEMILKIGYRNDVDWWCLGCLIYQMLTGYPPFRNQNKMKLMEQILSKPPDLSKLSSRVQDLLNKLLNKNPKKRLGHNAVAEIKDHVWFDRINWQAVKAMKIKPPFIPKLLNETDTTNFDTKFTKKQIKSYDQYCNDDSGQYDNNKFKDFSFNVSVEI